jgi:hypothetical protein
MKISGKPYSLNKRICERIKVDMAQINRLIPSPDILKDYPFLFPPVISRPIPVLFPPKTDRI